MSTAISVDAPATRAPSSAANPTPPSPNTATVSPGQHLGAVERRTHPGEHRTAEQGGDLMRQIGVDANRGAHADDRIVGERGDPQVVMQRAPRARRPTGTRLRAATRRRWPARQVRTMRRDRRGTARTARSWGRRRARRGRRPPALRPPPQLHHFAGGLVPQHHRHHARAGAIDHRQIGVAQARRMDPDQHLARARAGPAPARRSAAASSRVGRCLPHLVQHRAADLHADGASDSTTQPLKRARAARSGISPTGRRLSRSTNTCTNQPVARTSSWPRRYSASS